MGHIHQLLAHYGAAAVFVGAAFEGNTAVLAGGFLAHQHLMSLWTALLSATAGSALIDQLLFLAGRGFRDHRWVARTSTRPAFARALGFIERFPVGYILAFRFLYGLRLISPVAIGVSQIPAWRFAALNALAALLWAGVFTVAGAVGGAALESALGRSVPLSAKVAIAAAILVVSAVALHLARRTRQRRSAQQV